MLVQKRIHYQSNILEICELRMLVLHGLLITHWHPKSINV
jgi:hypothetical protein